MNLPQIERQLPYCSGRDGARLGPRCIVNSAPILQSQGGISESSRCGAESCRFALFGRTLSRSRPSLTLLSCESCGTTGVGLIAARANELVIYSRSLARLFSRGATLLDAAILKISLF